ncbi:succinate dehydrogenase/fumarate reductase iron-sulfur subunit [Pseudobdellovibrio exovorus]|uniref:Succinate dehydrogenase/fumarate reductase iron-sulfur subunit n=1 Tax=Pseudobdellovibrio exovorus JSS TaxID=1184267 RepID=M4V8B8_9BACT|nr:succinate dehydrogenase/fumarate reductase iron-sulfur subunit [Pseudobdellovibrio exovorus]AGH94241.1 succinate dehydrogenase/fumarate reductase iron-sulfur subunit [Pseudobdellovibrio exovorus JSS]
MEAKKNINLKLKVWRQKGAGTKGQFVTYEANGISPDASFLEMLDYVNEGLIQKGDDPIVFDHDCREGICGSCGFMINGNAHGPERGTTVCQLHMRHFKDGEELVLEPWRAKAFPIIKDLMCDRSALDRIISSGGYISVNTGNAQDANNLPIPKPDADEAFLSAACIGCGACVASCKNASAALFTSAKITHMALLPQGKVERGQRALNMVSQMDAEGFGACTSTGACSASCPKDISLINIAKMNREYLLATITQKEEMAEGGAG